MPEPNLCTLSLVVPSIRNESISSEVLLLTSRYLTAVFFYYCISESHAFLSVKLCFYLFDFFRNELKYFLLTRLQLDELIVSLPYFRISQDFLLLWYLIAVVVFAFAYLISLCS